MKHAKVSMHMQFYGTLMFLTFWS